MQYLKDTLIYKIRTLRKKVLAAAPAALEGTGLTAELYFALRFIYETPGCSQKELADLLLTDANIIVRGIDKLEKLSLVRRARHPNDRRAYALYITEKGKQLVLDKWEKLIENQEACLSDLTEKQRKLFSHFFDIAIAED